MADISLLFDVLGGESITENGSSGKTIADQLSKIVEKINKDPLKIKFEMDPESVKDIEKTITGLSKRFTNLQKKIESTANTLNTKFNSGDHTGSLGQLSTQIGALITALNASGKSGGGGTSGRKTKTITTVKEVGSALQGFRSLLNKGASVLGDNQTYTAFAATVGGLSGELDRAIQSGKAFDDELSEGVYETLKRARLEAVQLKQVLASTPAPIAAPALLGDNSGKLSSTQKKIDQLIQRANKYKTDYTKAKHGNSRDAYDKIDKVISDLNDLTFDLGGMEDKKAQEEIKRIEKDLSKINNTIINSGENTKTFAERVRDLTKRFGEWFSITRIVVEAYQMLRRMVSSVIELDTAMTELKKVTDETDARYDAFLRNATTRAKTLGAALTDTVTATADFARLGYTIEEAEKMADAAIIYKNVGDGIQDINTASESIIATMQAFGIKATDVMSIVDRFNEVGNNFAISSSGIGEALLRSAAAMHSAGNTIDETIALATAANTIVQSPETVGTTLKTISMYLRAAKTEAEEAGESTEGMASSVSELREEILDLSGQRVDVMIDEDTFKSTYQIMKELSSVWDSITDTSRANILEMVGGKRNANIVSALLENFTVAEEALTSSLNSAGSAVAENEKQLDSIRGKISLLQASFESLSATVINGDFIKFVVGGAAELVGWLEKAITLMGGLEVIIPSVLGLFVSSQVSNIIGLLSGLKSNTGWLGKIIGSITKNASVLKAYFATMITGSHNASIALSTLGGTAAVASASLSALTIGIGVIAAVCINAKKKQEELRAELIAGSQAASSLSDEITDLYTQYSTLSNAIGEAGENTQELASVQDSIIDKLGLHGQKVDELVARYGNYKKAITEATKEELYNQRLLMLGATSSYEQNVIDAYNPGKTINIGTGQDDGGLLSFLKGNYSSLIGGRTLSNTTSFHLRLNDLGYDLKTAAGVIATQEALFEMLRNLEYHGFDDTEFFSDLASYTSSLDSSISEYQNHLKDLDSNLLQYEYLNTLSIFGTPETQEDFSSMRSFMISSIETAKDFKVSYEEAASSVDDFLSNQTDFAKFFDGTANETVNTSITALSTFKDKILLLKKALDEQNRTGSVTTETYQEISKLGEECADMFDFASGKTTLNTESMNTYIDSLVKETGAILASNDATEDQVTEMARLANEVRAVDKEVDIAIDTLGSLADVLKDAIDGTEMSAMQMANLITQYPELASAIQLTTNGYKLEKEAVRNLVRAKAEMLRLDELEAKAKARDRIISGPGTEQTIANVDKIFSVHGGSIHSFEDYVKIVGGSVTDNWIAGFRDYVEASIMQIERDNAINQLVSDMLDPDKYVFGEKPQASAENVESAFSIAYQKHQHLLAMEQETEQDYLEWLTDAYQQAYMEKQISLDEYYRYQEEVYAKSKELFKDNLNDVDKAIDRKNRKGDSASVIKLYQTQLSRINKEIQKYRELGLDNYSDYIQELESLLWSYQDKLLDVLQTPIDASKDAADGLSTILELTQDLIRWENERLIEALEKEKEQYADIVDKKKEALSLSREQERHDRSSADKIAEIAKLQSKIDQLALDDSREAFAQRSQLEDELAEMQKSLAEEQADYAYNQQVDALDREYEAFEESKDNEIEGLQNMLSSAEKLYATAIDRISNHWDSLYNDLETWNLEYGSTLQDDLVSAWDAASDAVKRYGSFVTALDTVNTTNYGISESGGFESSIVNMMKKNSSMWTDSTASGRKKLEDKNVELAGILANYLGKKITRGSDGVWMIDSKRLYDIYHTGGIVGGNGSLSQNETMALLENGEMVLDDKKQRFLLSAAGFIKDLSDRIGSTIDVSKLSALSVFTGKKSNISTMLDKLDSAGGGEFNFQPNVNVYITHNGEMSDAEARRYGETAADAVLEKLNGAFSKRGITHAGHNLIKT